MTGAPVSCDREADRSSSSLVARCLLMLADDDLGGLLLHGLAVERDDGQRQLAVVGEELALDDVVRLAARR